mgnify:CR=1 FL=1
MSILGRYINYTVGGAIVIALSLIVGLDIVSAVIDQLDKLQGNYTFWQALNYVLMTIPGRIHEYIPLSVLIGCLAGMGLLASSSEITVMRSSGVSLLKLMLWAMRPVLIVVIVSLLISEYVSPVTDRWAKTHKDLKLWGESHSQVSSGGLWHKEDNTYMHFNVVQPGGVLYGLTFFYFDEQQNLSLMRSAKRASFINDNWLLEDVIETQLSDTQVDSDAQKTLRWDTRITPESLSFLANKPEEMSPSQLYQYGSYLDENQLDNKPYRLAFWQKILQPLAVFSLVVIALSFVFGPLRATTIGFRVFVGIVVGIAFQFSQNLLGPASMIYGFSPLLAVCLPIVACAGIGFVLLYRAG